VCGHIHQPRIRYVTTRDRTVLYLNSGDWIENMSALEYTDGIWSIHAHEGPAQEHRTAITMPVEVPAEAGAEVELTR
jgi:hypothetical protein